MDGGGHDGNVSVFDKRRGGKGLGDGLVDYHIETPDKVKSIFQNAGVSTPSYNKLKLNNQQSIDTFKKAIAKAKQSLGEYGASVELKDDYTDINLYLSEDGHERLKEYLSKYDINIDSKVFVDSLIDLNNYIDNEGDIDITEDEINNDIEYYIDSVKEYIDAKKKDNIPAGTEWKTLDNGEHILVNSATGEVIKGAGGSLNKSNDKDKDKDKKDNDNKDNSNPKKSNCNIGDTYNIAINDMATIPAKKIAESNSYELYDEKDYFNKLNSKKKQDLENALQYASEKYDELFNIYGLSDSQPTNKLKVVLISQKDYKDMKGAAGFTLRAGASEEDSNNIFVNIDTIKKNDMNYINEVLLHETMHSIINDNLRNAKTNERPSKILEEALAETATFIANDKNYRDTDNPKVLLFNKYYFTSNLMHYFYLKNNKNSGIFKDIIEKRQTRFMDAVQDIGNKVGIQGSKADIIKQFLKDKCNITDSDATMFILDLERKMKNPNW